MIKWMIAMALVLVSGSVAFANQWHGEAAYLRCNPDVREAVYYGEFRSGWHHYQAHGRYEQRLTDGDCYPPHWFDDNAYLRCNPDVRAAVRRNEFVSGYHHYRQFGQYENRKLRCR